MSSSKYEILEKIGQGGMGVVYRVRHVELGTILALKMLPTELAREPELVARFRREARVMARLNHANIVRVFDLVQEADQFYLVMEYLRGKNLREHLTDYMRRHDRPLEVREVVRIGMQVCAGLAYAHEQTPSVVHRDIKPANIILEAGTGRVVITDFGIAKLVGESQTQLTRTGGFVGTLKYSSPEQMRHDAAVDGRSDVYSLGVVLHELYTGRQLFSGMTDEQVVGRVLYGSAEEEVLLQSDEEFAHIVQQAMTRDRHLRYGSARALLVDLEEYLRAAEAADPVPPSVAADVVDEPSSVAGEARESSGSGGSSGSASWSAFSDDNTHLAGDVMGAAPEAGEARRSASVRRRIASNVRYLAARWWVLLTVVPAFVVAALCTADGLPWIDRPFPGFFIMENRVVPTAAAYHWSGLKAGLPNHSSIVRVGEEVVATGNDVYRHAEAVPVGTALAYTIRKGATELSLAIPTMKFTLLDFALTFGLLGVNGIVIIFTGFVVALLSPRNRAARVFLAMSLMMGLYPVTGSDLWRAHRFTLLQLLTQCLTPATFIHLATVFPVERDLSRGVRWLVVGVPYLVGAAMAAWLVQGFWADPVDLRPLYAGYAYSGIGLIALIAGCLLAYVQHRRQVVRGRVQVVVVGVVCAFLLPIIGFFNNMLSGGDFPLNLIAFTPILFFVAVAYAIVKYKLFDAQLFIRRSVTLATLLAVFTTMYVVVVTTLNAMLATTGIEAHSPQFMGGFMALSLASALPLRDQLSTAIERRLFPHKYRSHQTIDLLCRSIARTDDLGTVLDEATRGLASAMNLTAGAVILREAEGGTFRVAAAFGEAPTLYALESDNPLVRILAGTRREVFKEDFEEDADLSGIRDVCLAVIADLRAELVIPLLSGGALVGVLALGRHAGSDVLTSEDLQMLRSLAAGLALAAVRSVDASRALGLVLQRRILEHYLPPPAMRVLLGRDPTPAIVERVRMASVAVRMAGIGALAARLTPEAMTAVLRDFYALCDTAVRNHGGKLERHEGDRVRAIFTATPGATTEAVRAAQAAMAIQKAFVVYRTTPTDAGDVGDVAAGVACGFGHVAQIDRGSRTTMQSLGMTSNLAERLCERAEGGVVLAEGTTAAAVASHLTAIRVGTIEVRGIPGGVEIFGVRERVAA